MNEASWTRYSVSNALFQWEDGERRVRGAPPLERADLERAVDTVLDELRRRLGSAFSAEELAELYGSSPDWAAEIAAGAGAAGDTAAVVDAAFNRYAREATNFAGGRPRRGSRRP